MRHENGNCQPAGGFCTAVRETVCEALQNAYQMGYMDMGIQVKAEDIVKVIRCKDCKNSVCIGERYFCDIQYDEWGQPYVVKSDGYCDCGERKETK